MRKPCGLLPIDPRHHAPETGYRDTITGRNLDRWDAWLVGYDNDKTPLYSLKNQLRSGATRI